MRNSPARFAIVFGAVVLGLILLNGVDQAGAQAPGAGKTRTPPPINCSSNISVAFGSTVPGDAALSVQQDADCFAWAEFIALNWPSSGSNFGTPGDLSAVQWQSFMQQETLYPANGQAPPAWGSQTKVPGGCPAASNLSRAARGNVRVLASASKFKTANGTSSFLPPEIEEAAPGNAPSWLGAQNGTNVWYEVVLNKDIYDFVTDPSRQFYNASKQQSFVNNGQGSPIVFTKGSVRGTPTGSIEMKAAWMEVPNYNPAQPGKWVKYKLAPAVVIGPSNNQCRSTTVALVGLHIIHKTQSQPTWIWATFEHVDNVPGPNQTSDCCNFNSTSCQPQQVTVSQASCLGPNQQSPVTVGCTANTSPPYYLGPGCPNPVPIQITRTTALDSVSLSVNKTVTGAIQTAFPGSVYQYYQLVDVLWSTNPTQDPTAPAKVPLNPQSLTAGNIGRVFNTVLESYAQSTQCTDCHRYAVNAPASAQSPWDSDFSFAIGTASPAASKAGRRPKSPQP